MVGFFLGLFLVFFLGLFLVFFLCRVGGCDSNGAEHCGNSDCEQLFHISSLG